MYDADMDDLDSIDLEKQSLKRSNSSVYYHEIVESMGSLKTAIYQLTLMVAILFLCSSIFTYFTKREVIFPESTAPKYIFDMV